MGVKKKNWKKPHLLSRTRPPILSKTPSLSSKATRKLIRSHHTLQKQLTHAIAANDPTEIAAIKVQLNSSGGLLLYQRASIQGQSSERGGDSSKVLMEWLAPILNQGSGPSNLPRRLRLLEVGALRVDNACSRNAKLDIERIDLHSQHKMILEQDFMERPAPLPEDLASDGFDIVSLSLVVNYVGDSVGRGEMLRRVGKFLRERPAGEMAENLFPGLFFVLPAPCVLNSRFLNEHRLGEMLASLGFTLARRKMSNKLVYYYWTFRAKGDVERKAFEKKELRKGGGKNNFCIILR